MGKIVYHTDRGLFSSREKAYYKNDDGSWASAEGEGHTRDEATKKPREAMRINTARHICLRLV